MSDRVALWMAGIGGVCIGVVVTALLLVSMGACL